METSHHSQEEGEMKALLTSLSPPLLVQDLSPCDEAACS